MAGRDLPRALAAELAGTLLLASVVVGSGIAAQHLSPADDGLQLLENAAATAAGLYAIILALEPVSGAHLNPVVSFADAALGGLRWSHAACYAATQTVGCAAGAVLADVMFSHPAVSIATHHRASGGHLIGEAAATAGLVLVVFSLARTGKGDKTPAAVAGYIGAAYFSTSSTSFADPAITVGRTLSDTFAGIAPSSVPAFVAAQALGGAIGLGAVVFLHPSRAGGRAGATGRDGVDRPAPPAAGTAQP